MNALGIRGDVRYRRVDEARIIDLVALKGWAFELAAGEIEAARTAALSALQGWIELGLPFARGPGGERRFDPAEVANFSVWAGKQGLDPFWETRFVATARRMVRAMHGFEDNTDKTLPAPPPVKSLLPRVFSITLYREFQLPKDLPGATVRLRLPLPLLDASLSDFRVDYLPHRDLEIDFEQRPGRLDARISAPLSRSLRLGYHAVFIAGIAQAVERASLSAAERQLYTRPGEGIVQVTPRLRALAAALVGRVEEPLGQLQRFWQFLLEQRIFGVVHYDEVDPRCPADWILDSGWFDCQLGSALLVGLCRARGIPARLLSGFGLYPTAATYHYWCEAWIDGCGWFPLDTIASDLSMQGRDRAWRDYFFGAVNPRMKTQCLPRLFTGDPTLRFPRSWYLLTRATAEGTETAFYDNASDALVYRDCVAVTMNPP